MFSRATAMWTSPTGLSGVPPPGTCNTRDGDGEVRARLFERAFGHHARNGFGYSACVGDEIAGDVQHLFLGAIGIDDKTALNRGGRSRNFGQQAGDQAAGAAFSRRDLEPLLLRLVEREAGEHEEIVVEHRPRLATRDRRR